MSPASGRARPLAAVIVAALLAGCGRETPFSLTSVDLFLDYVGPAGIVVPPSTDVACPHHYAPVNLRVVTDWGQSAALAPGTQGHYGVTLRDAAIGREHWVALYDIQLCGLDPLAPPMATTGVTLNGVALTRQTTTPDGKKALAFTIDATGAIR